VYVVFTHCTYIRLRQT